MTLEAGVSYRLTTRKKLIEVALPLEAINRESAREKSIRLGHPSTLHLWWARRPLAACRAVIFGSLVDDPSSQPEKYPSEEAQEAERQRLFRILEQLVKWENSSNEEVLDAARAEIRKCTNGRPPPLFDPFCGGGSIPLEAQRLGLEIHASDLNPVAVLITKALVEIPPRFAGRPPVHPGRDGDLLTRKWRGNEGLAEDIRYYGQWVRDQAEHQIGHLYPKVKLGSYEGGAECPVIAWLWARTIPCPNPACGAEMPLVRSYWLSKKKGRATWVEPIVDKKRKHVAFGINSGEGGPPEGTVERRGARCIVCRSPVPFSHIRAEGKGGRMGARLMAICAQGERRRVYLPPSPDHEAIAATAEPQWTPETELLGKSKVNVGLYGIATHADLFTPRQLVALDTLSRLVAKARERALADARAAGCPSDHLSLSDGGTGAEAYADAVAIYLAFALDKSAEAQTTLCTWSAAIKNELVVSTFRRQALPMTWDFAEGHPFGQSSGSYEMTCRLVAAVLRGLPFEPTLGTSAQLSASEVVMDREMLTVTDPPYYDNIGYADLSDFFYVWLRRSLREVYPKLFGTVLTPKNEELVATPYRFEGNRNKAEQFFERGLRRAFGKMREVACADFPLVLYYAFKQAEDGGEDGVASTGWQTMLEGLIGSGFAVTATLPLRSERTGRSVAIGANALASSIVLACRPRMPNAPRTTRREFVQTLKRELPDAVSMLQRGNIAPVDLAQAAIGPGMAVFSRYSTVLEADGTTMRVRAALALINQVLDEILAAQDADYEADTRWALAWFEQFGFMESGFGAAETLCKAKNTSVAGLESAGILRAGSGKVRLLRRSELDPSWDPTTDERLTIWEITHHLISALEQRGERTAAHLLRRVGSKAEVARELTYRLYQICERKRWAEEALGYNMLIVAWPEISRLAQAGERGAAEQLRLA